MLICAKNPLYMSGEKVIAPKTICIYSSHNFWVYNKMGEVLIDFVHQYPALWYKQDAMYKDSNYEEAKWKEIADILCISSCKISRCYKWYIIIDIDIKFINCHQKS